MKLRSKFLIALLAIFLTGSVQTFAQKKSDCDGHKKGGIENKIPDLTDKQKEDINKIELDYKKAVLPVTNELREKRAKLKTLQSAETPDTKAIEGLIDDMGKLRTDLQKLRSKKHQDIRNLLTEDQKIVFDTKASSHSGHKCGGTKKKGCEKKCKH